MKSTSRIRLLWVDEAEALSESAWQKAIPTVREENAEIWVCWNPERRASATNQRFREHPPENSKICEVNWRDNPWFPWTLEQIRSEDQRLRPDTYEHIWEGAYATAHAGAYYAALLAEAMREGRVGKVTRDPLMSIRAYVDIGGTGARSDAYPMWICQFVGREMGSWTITKAVRQSLGVHIDWLREHGWERRGFTSRMTVRRMTVFPMFPLRARFRQRDLHSRSFQTRVAGPPGEDRGGRANVSQHLDEWRRLRQAGMRWS